jgi:Family of unknown function (DUF5694)
MRIAKAAAAVLAVVAGVAPSMRIDAVADEPIEVMIVGMVHMANPGTSRHNTEMPDVLLPQYQAEIARMTEGLARFKPTQVHVEWEDEREVAADYARYLAGELQPRRDEIVQVAFRLAKLAGLAKVHASDTSMRFDFGSLFKFIAEHGKKEWLAAEDAKGKAKAVADDVMVRTRGILPLIRLLNRPEEIVKDHVAHRALLALGAGEAQPGAEYWAGWTRRNILICAKIIQAAKLGDRLAVFFGSSHAFQLRQCIGETPGFKLIEANDYLPD